MNATAAPAAGAGERTFVIDPAQTEASYAVQEVFLQQNSPFRAVGKTNQVEGSFTISLDGKPSGKVTKITVNLPSLTSDSDRRDGKIRTDWLESEKYPVATFVSTGVEGVPASYTDGQDVSFKLTGDLTIHDTTTPVTFDVVGKLSGDTVTGKATSKIQMTDFGFNPPDIGGFVKVENDVDLTITFVAKAQ